MTVPPPSTRSSPATARRSAPPCNAWAGCPPSTAPPRYLALHALAEHAEPGPSRLDSDAVCAARDRALARPDDLAALLVAGTLPPTDLWPARGVGQLFAVIARLGATGDWIALTRAALRDGWN